MKQIDFINKRLVDQVQLLIDKDLPLMGFMVMGQGIEILGAFIDKKPFKVQGQSKKRFNIAIEKLFDKRYQKLNQNDFLYKQLRSNLVHLLIESKFLNLTSNKHTTQKHLSFQNKKTTLLLEDMFLDFKKACEFVIENLKTNKLKHKILPYG